MKIILPLIVFILTIIGHFGYYILTSWEGQTPSICSQTLYNKHDSESTSNPKNKNSSKSSSEESCVRSECGSREKSSSETCSSKKDLINASSSKKNAYKASTNEKHKPINATSENSNGPLQSYINKQEYFLGISYGLALAFTGFSLMIFREKRKRGVVGAFGGLGLSGVLAAVVCFLVGCCGSPMLGVYISLFGSRFLGFTKPLVAILTVLSVLIGFIWVTKKSKSCCQNGICPPLPKKQRK